MRIGKKRRFELIVTKRCRKCGAKFGLIRQTFIREQFCSKACVEAYKQEWQKRHQWLGWLMTPNGSAGWPHAS